MASKVILSEEALGDLFDIWRFIATDSGSERADAVDGRLRAACLKLADFPHRGSPRDELEAGLRSIAFEGRATIYYRTQPGAVEIVRILYAGRDQDRELGAS